MSTEKQQAIVNAFYNPANAFRPKTILAAVRHDHPELNINISDVQAVVKAQEASQRFAPASAPKRTNWYPLTSIAPFSTMSMDLADMRTYNPVHNAGMKYCLVLTDRYTKYTFLRAVKSKGQAELLNAFQDCMKQLDSWGYGPPDRLVMDFESSWFKGKQFRDYLDKIECSPIFAHEVNQVGDVESRIKTLRMIIARMVTALKTDQWVNHLSEIQQGMNQSINATIYTTPDEAIAMGTNAKLEARWQRQIERAQGDKRLLSNVNLQVGSKVRIKLHKRKGFDKLSSMPNWSDTIHTIERKVSNNEFYVNDRTKPYRRDQLQVFTTQQVRPEPAEEKQQEDEKQQPHTDVEQTQYVKQKRTTRRLRKEGVVQQNVTRQLRERVPRAELLTEHDERIIS